MKKIEWKTEKRKVKDLIPQSWNPRKISEKQRRELEKSLQKFNLADIPVIDQNNNIIGGHQRVAILMALGRGEEEIDVRVPSRKLTEKEVKELNLRLNRNTGEWDWELLSEIDSDLLEEVGFEESELDNLVKAELADEFDEEEAFQKSVQKPRGVRPGDIWRLGDHILVCGNATHQEDWEAALRGDRFDFLFTDPPYRLAYSRKRTRGETDRDGKPRGVFGSKQNRRYEGVDIGGGVPEFDEWLSIANEMQNPRGANVMVFENWRNTVELWQAIEKYWKIRNMVIWHIPNRHQGYSVSKGFFSKYDIAMLGGEVPLNKENEEEMMRYMQGDGSSILETCEVAIYGNQGESVHDKPKKTIWWQVSDHITFRSENYTGSGQALVYGTKPVQILVPFVKILSPRHGIVMEPFGGSGSTLIACEILKRSCRVIELSPRYCEVIISRWEKFSGKSAERIGAVDNST